MSRSEKRWLLTRSAFDGLLGTLDPDRERAGERYERLRRKLVAYFEWRGACDAEGLADETLNRVARRIACGERISNVPGYALGVARLVLREASRASERARSVPVEMAGVATHEARDDVELKVFYVEQGLAALSPEDRQLILDYYAADSRGTPACRKAIARRLGISANALRLRAYRIRGELERRLRLYKADAGVGAHAETQRGRDAGQR